MTSAQPNASGDLHFYITLDDSSLHNGAVYPDGVYTVYYVVDSSFPGAGGDVTYDSFKSMQYPYENGVVQSESWGYYGDADYYNWNPQTPDPDPSTVNWELGPFGQEEVPTQQGDHWVYIFTVYRTGVTGMGVYEYENASDASILYHPQVQVAITPSDAEFFDSASYEPGFGMVIDQTNEVMYYNQIGSTGGFQYSFGQWYGNNLTLVYKSRLQHTGAYNYGGGSGYGQINLLYGIQTLAQTHQQYQNTADGTPFSHVFNDGVLGSNTGLGLTNMSDQFLTRAIIIDWDSETMRYVSFDSTDQVVDDVTHNFIFSNNKPAVTSENLFIQLKGKGANNYEVQDFALFQAALTNEEIAALQMRGDPVPPQPGLVDPSTITGFNYLAPDTDTQVETGFTATAYAPVGNPALSYYASFDPIYAFNRNMSYNNNMAWMTASNLLAGNPWTAILDLGLPNPKTYKTAVFYFNQVPGNIHHGIFRAFTSITVKNGDGADIMPKVQLELDGSDWIAESNVLGEPVYVAAFTFNNPVSTTTYRFVLDYEHPDTNEWNLLNHIAFIE